MVRETATATAIATATSSGPSWALVPHKGQSTDAVLKRLKDLHDRLNRQQKDLDSAARNALGRQLTQQELLFHSSKDVRTVLACCLADLLRLCVSSGPPFEGRELEAVLHFFLTVLTGKSSGLGHPNKPLFEQAITLLETLTKTQILVLVSDVEGTEQLLIDYFTRLFNVMKPETPRSVVLSTASMLADMVIEGVVPRKVVEILLGYLHATVKKTNPTAALLAAQVCNKASNELQMHIHLYFNECILKATAREDGPDQEQALEKVHFLAASVYRSAPSVMANTIPQLEAGLHAENDTLREISVRTLGQMLADKPNLNGEGGDLALKFPSVWKAWLGRSFDKSASIRAVWTEAVRGLIINHSELRGELEEVILHKLVDPDEKVRLSLIKTFGNLTLETLRQNVSRKVLKQLGERALDKKASVRSEALDVLGRAFSLAFPELQQQQAGSEALEHFGWIPDAVLSAISQDLSSTLVPVQQTFAKHILPLPESEQDSEKKWADRFLFVMRFINDESVERLIRIANIAESPRQFYQFLDACKSFNGGHIDGSQDARQMKERILSPLQRISLRFPDPQAAARQLEDFARLNDSRAYKLLLTLMDGRSDIKTCMAAKLALEKKLRVGKGESNTTASALILMCSYVLVNTSLIPALLTHLQSEEACDARMRRRLFTLLKIIANHQASMFVGHITQLVGLAQESGKSNRVAAISFLALAKLKSSGAEANSTDFDRISIKKVCEQIRKGSHLEAKYAAKLLAVLANNSVEAATACSTTASLQLDILCEEIKRNLPSYSPSRKAASMAALTQVTKHAKDTVMHLDEALVSLAMKEILLTPWSDENTSRVVGAEDEVEWLEDEEINDDLRARILAIGFLTQRCASNAEEIEVVRLMVQPVHRLLFTCLQLGQLSENMGGNGAARSRLRLASALSLLKLARHSHCDREVGWENFQLFASTVQDEIFDVRHIFLRKLAMYWRQRSSNLPARYYILGFMSAFDPEPDTKILAEDSCLRLQSIMTAELRLKYFDLGLARLLHLLAHFPDFSEGKTSTFDKLKEAACYLEFYLVCCASERNLACLYYIANRCKGHEDIAGAQASESLYRLADLAMCLIKRQADSMGCNVGNWAGKVSLPSDIYQPLRNRELQTENYQRSFLSEDESAYFRKQALTKKMTMMNALKRKTVPFSNESKSKRVLAKSSGSKGRNSVDATRKRKSSASTTTRTKKRKSAREEEENDDMESELSEDFEEDGKSASEGEEEIEEDEDTNNANVSEDEKVDGSADEAEGRSARIREKKRKEREERNRDRQRRRLAKGTPGVAVPAAA